ncbi:hypothetical protein M422DRAFT_64837 [Sphaerobolus stellatus SS14]|nr:hypothetical protein M422DRAFT_64837 [Sphaerobolus stellatus SS14]
MQQLVCAPLLNRQICRRRQNTFRGICRAHERLPSTHRVTIWRKMQKLGADGPIFAWLRMLYTSMRSVVRGDDELSELFLSSLGVLQGDSSSPVLYLIHCSGFALPADPDDVFFGGTPISLRLGAWAATPPSPPHSLFTDSFTYLGCTFSTLSHVFDDHYYKKAATATRVANTVLAMSRQVGSLPVHEGRMLYTTRVDPHLTSCAEVVIDVVKTALQRLEYRRLDLTLRYLHHVLLPSPSLFVRAAFDECASWLGDLIHALRHLPMPMILPPTGLTPTVIDNDDNLLRVLSLGAQGLTAIHGAIACS